jgi:CDP-diacylglycerol--serine O-phosphatidyltransferase
MPATKPNKPFSMIREFQLADWFTLANAICGTGALFSTMTYLETGEARHVYFASALVFAALVFDVLDGRIARWRQQSSTLGRELDSLADVISFGVAPAFLVYHWGLSGYGRAGLLVSFLFAVCGALRLARFNVQVHVVDKRWFVGLPIPSAAGALCGLIWAVPSAQLTDTLRAGFLGITAALAFLMVSTFRYRSFKDVDAKSRRGRLYFLLFAAILGLIWWLRQYALAGLLAAYAASAPVGRLAGFFRGRPKDAAA